MPGADHGIGFGHSCIEGRQLHGQHHQEHIGEQADRVDPIGECCAVIALLLHTQAPCQTGIGEIAHQQADPSGRKNLSEQQGIGIAQHAAAEADDEQDLNQVVQTQGQESIQVAGPPRTHGPL